MQKPLQYSLGFVLHPEEDAAYVHFENANSNPFDPARGLSRANVWWLAEAALASYWDEVPGSAIFAAAGLNSEFLSAGSTQCYVAWRDGFVMVAFRGTQPDKWDDILTDAKATQKAWDAGEVHLGFAEGLDAIWSQLKSVVKLLVDGGRSVWFCGHSLGAALAVLAAYRFANECKVVGSVCTFGCPRVGNPDFVAAFEKTLGGRSLRYVNDNDVVTHVPPPLFLICVYEHVTERRHIASDGTVSLATPPIEHFYPGLIGELKVLLGIVNALRDGSLAHAPAFILDHMPKAYAVLTWNDFDRNG
jgi:triacylglycerol lipase